MNIVGIVMGGIFIWSGTILFGLVHLAIATHGAGYQIVSIIEQLTVTKTWIPYILSIIEILVGIILILGSRNHAKPIEEE
mgnify:FL=1